MKNLLLLSCLLLSGTLALNAQTEAGKVLIGTSTNLYGVNTLISSLSPKRGGLSLGSYKFKSDNFESDARREMNLNLSPRAGFFAADNLLIGLEATFAHWNPNELDGAVTSLAGGPFARYYLSSANFKPFVQVGGSAGQISLIEGDKLNIFSYGVDIGGAFFLNDKVAVDLLVQYSHLTMKSTDAVDNARTITSSFGIGVGFSIFL